VTGLVRYSASDLLRSQRWVAPVLAFLTVEAVIAAGNGTVMPTYAVSAVALLFVTTWLTVVALNVEDPVQEAVTGVVAGSHARPRVAKLLVAFFFGAALGAVAVVTAPLVSTDGVRAANLGAGVGAHLLTALAGVAVGALCSRPIVARTAWAVVGGFALCLLDALVPGVPPGRQLLELFDGDHVRNLGGRLSVTAAETVVLAVVIVVASQRLVRARTR
jgi:hypothetical protein